MEFLIALILLSFLIYLAPVAAIFAIGCFCKTYSTLILAIVSYYAGWLLLCIVLGQAVSPNGSSLDVQKVTWELLQSTWKQNLIMLIGTYIVFLVCKDDKPNNPKPEIKTKREDYPPFN